MKAMTAAARHCIRPSRRGPRPLRPRSYTYRYSCPVAALLCSDGDHLIDRAYLVYELSLPEAVVSSSPSLPWSATPSRLGTPVLSPLSLFFSAAYWQTLHAGLRFGYLTMW
eukprot:GHVU01039523.1.p1 GENE.GHVU01039523.1~~GHVU01039523.1.p1  ORF type:complete len:111 (-),score=1.52 GHVU01039523.1:43-375(-)